MGRIVNATVPDGLREGDTFSLPYVDKLPVAAATATPANTPLSQAVPSSSSSGAPTGGDGEPSGSSGPSSRSSAHQSVISEQPTLQSDPS